MIDENKRMETRIALGDLKIHILQDAEIKTFVEGMQNLELFAQQKFLEGKLKELLEYMNVRTYDMYRRSLTMINEELMKREEKEGVDPWKI